MQEKSDIIKPDVRPRMGPGVPLNRTSFPMTSQSAQPAPPRSIHALRVMANQRTAPLPMSFPHAASPPPVEPTLGAAVGLHVHPSPDYYIECIVCVRPIEPSTRESDTWKSYHQPMEMERCVEQLLPVEKYPSRKNNAMIHSCCWEVAWNVLGRPPLKDSWLAQFTSHLVYLRPFATKTLFDCETNDIDHELWAETPSRDRIESAGKQDTQGALHSMIQEASSWLERNPGIVCIDDVQKMDQFLAFCLIKGIPYQLATDKDTDIRPHLRRALQSLKASATSRLPKTFNLWVAWNNTKSALDSFRSLPRPRPLTLDPELYGLTAVIKYSVPAEQCHRLIFSFRTRPVPHPGSWPMLELVMFAYDGKVIGSAGLAGRNLSVSLTIQSLRGIHIVQDRAGSITAIRVRDGQRWTAWYGAPKLGSHDSEHEWESPEKNLVINYDSKLLQIIGVGVKSRVSDLPC